MYAYLYGIGIGPVDSSVGWVDARTVLWLTNVVESVCVVLSGVTMVFI